VLERREHRQGTGVVQSGILHARVSPVYDSLKPPAKLSRKRLKWIDIHRVYCLRRIVIVAAIMVLLLRLFVFVIHSLFVRLQRSRKGKQNLTITKPNETQSRSEKLLFKRRYTGFESGNEFYVKNYPRMHTHIVFYTLSAKSEISLTGR